MCNIHNIMLRIAYYFRLATDIDLTHTTQRIDNESNLIHWNS